MISQLGAATALTQLLTEGSHLWPCTWTIDAATARLSGRLAAGATMENLHEYAEVLGGSVRPYPEEPFQGRMMRRHVLTSQWREAVVQVALVIPEPNQDPLVILKPNPGALAECTCGEPRFPEAVHRVSK